MIWKPAKSAPQDGTRILVGFRDPLSGGWRSGVVMWRQGEWFSGHVRTRYADGSETREPIGCIGFTHWTPIIEPKK